MYRLVLGVFTTLSHRLTDFHVLIQRLHLKPQQVQLQTGFSRTLANNKKTMSSNFMTVLNLIRLVNGNIRRFDNMNIHTIDILI